MKDFRYDDKARTFDEELEKDLVAYEAEKTAKKEADRQNEPNGIARLAEKSPLDEVRELIDSTRHKSAEEEIRQHTTKKKLAAFDVARQTSIDEFITQAKNG